MSDLDLPGVYLGWNRWAISRHRAKTIATANGLRLPTVGREIAMEVDGHMVWMRNAEHRDERETGRFILHSPKKIEDTALTGS